jgi:hypothetical protein
MSWPASALPVITPRVSGAMVSPERVADRPTTALAIECKYQGSVGTVDEKIPFALQDLESMRIPVCVAYAGDGFSQGILHILSASPIAAWCLPGEKTLAPGPETRELDCILAMTFKWWDVLVRGKKRVAL